MWLASGALAAPWNLNLGSVRSGRQARRRTFCDDTSARSRTGRMTHDSSPNPSNGRAPWRDRRGVAAPRAAVTHRADRATPGAAPLHDLGRGKSDPLRGHAQCGALPGLACGVPPAAAPIDESDGHARARARGTRRGPGALPDHPAAPGLLAPLDRPLDPLRQLASGGVMGSPRMCHGRRSLTGVTLGDLAGKRVELLRDALPGLRSVAAFHGIPNIPIIAQWLRATEATAARLGLAFHPVRMLVDRRAFVAGTLGLLAAPLAAEAQQPSKVPPGKAVPSPGVGGPQSLFDRRTGP